MIIPLWLTPKVIKGSIFGIIIMSIFFTGFYARGKLDAGKIAKYKSEVIKIESNYNLAMDNLDRCLVNYDELRQIVSDTNKEVVRMNEEYNLKVVELEGLNRAVINRVNASHDAAIADMVAEATELRNLMSTLSQTEACHAAMEAIVQ